MANNNTLEMMNAASFHTNQPSFVLIAILLPFGIIANALTLYIFSWRETRSNLRIFLLFLTLIDLGCCLLGVPLVMVDLLLPIMHPSRALCKMQRFVLHFWGISCLFTLLIIAVERYKAICRPSGRQLDLFQAKKMTLAIVGVSLFFALPVALVADRIAYQLVYDIYGYICWYEFPAHWDIYVWTIFAIFWASLIIIFTLYCLVWKSTNSSEGAQDEPAEQNEGFGNAEQNRTKQLNRALLGASILCAVSLSPYMILNNIPWPEKYASWEMFKLFLIHLWITNCTGKPILYVAFDNRYREHLKGIFRKSDKSDANEAIKETEE